MKQYHFCKKLKSLAFNALLIATLLSFQKITPGVWSYLRKKSYNAYTTLAQAAHTTRKALAHYLCWSCIKRELSEEEKAYKKVNKYLTSGGKDDSLPTQDVKKISPNKLIDLCMLAIEKEKSASRLLSALNESLTSKTESLSKEQEFQFREWIAKKATTFSQDAIKNLPTEQLLIENKQGSLTVQAQSDYEAARKLPSKILAALRNYDWKGRTPEATRSIVLEMLKKMNEKNVDIRTKASTKYQVTPEIFFIATMRVPNGTKLLRDAIYYSDDLLQYITGNEENIKSDFPQQKDLGTLLESARLLQDIRNGRNIEKTPEKLQNVSWAGHSPLQEAVKYGRAHLVDEWIQYKAPKQPKVRLIGPTEHEKDGTCILLSAAEGLRNAAYKKSEKLKNSIITALSHVLAKALVEKRDQKQHTSIAFNVEGPSMETPWLIPNDQASAAVKNSIKKANDHIIAYRLVLACYDLHTTISTTYTSRASVIQGLMKNASSSHTSKADDLLNTPVSIIKQQAPFWEHLVTAYTKQAFDIETVLKALGNVSLKKEDIQELLSDVQDKNKKQNINDAFEKASNITILD